MDIEMKVQILRACSSKKGNRCSSCPAFGQGDRNCIRNDMKDASTDLSTLQAENERLRVEVENYRKGHCAEDGCATEKDRDAVLAELEQVKRCIEIVENQRDQMKRERDAAVEDLHKLCPAWKWDGEEG